MDVRNEEERATHDAVSLTEILVHMPRVILC